MSKLICILNTFKNPTYGDRLFFMENKEEFLLNVEEIRNQLRATVAENVKKYRSIKGYTQLELAEKADVSAESVAKIESRKQGLSENFIVKISLALGITPGQLCNHPELDKLIPIQLVQSEISEFVEKFYDEKAIHDVIYKFQNTTRK